MNQHADNSILGRVAAWCTRRPWPVLGAALMIVLLSVFALARTRVSGSLQAMLGSSTPSSAALARVASDYRVLDELLVLVSIPTTQVAGSESTERLVAFAEKLKNAIARDPEAASMTESIRFREDPEFARFAREVILPSGVFYLSDDSFDALIDRLQPGRIRAQIAMNEALIAAPGAGGALAAAVLRDPLRLVELLDSPAMPEFAPQGPGSLQSDESLELSLDGRTLMIRIAGARPVDDLEFARALTDRVTALARAVNPGDLSVDLAGGYAIATSTSRAIRADSIVSAVVSVVLLQAIFFAFYRRIGAPLLIGGVAGAGIVAGFGLHALFVPTITPLTAVIAAMLAGLGVDYGIHFLSHYEANRRDGMTSAEASIATTRHLGVPIVTNCLTSTFGFASLWPSSVAMLRDFAILGTLGLVGALLSVLIVMPAALVVLDRRPRRGAVRLASAGLVSGIERRPRVYIGAALALLGVVVAGAGINGFVPGLETDLTVMHPRPNRALDLTDGLFERFGGAADTLALELHADSPDSLVTAAHEVARVLATQRLREAGVKGVRGLNSLVPEPRAAHARSARLAALKPVAVIESFDAAIAASIFDPDAYARYRALLVRMLSPALPGIADIAASPAIARRIFPRDELRAGTPLGRTLLAVETERPLSDRNRREAAISAVRDALDPIPGVALTGMSVVAFDLEQATRADLPRSIAISLVLVCAWLLLVFRRLADAMLALVPLCFAGVGVVGFMAATGQRFNPLNGVALPLLDGIAVDAGVFLVAAARAHPRDPGGLRRTLGSTVHAVLAAATTTVAGFGALAFTRTPAIQSLGLLTCVGIISALLGALLFLMPAIFLRARAGQAL